MNLMTYFTWTPLELAANFMTAICIFLAGRNNIHTWWTGIVASVLFAVLFFNNQLYADSTLQVFFLITGVMGWVGWSSKADSQPLPITNVNPVQIIKYNIAAVAVGVVYAAILHKFTDAYMPWVDSAVLVFSVVAQILLMRRQVETWMVWILVNTLSVPLFWSRELYLTSVLYGFFWVNAIVSLRLWTKLYKETEQVA